MKSLLKNPFTRTLLTWCLHKLILLAHHTNRWTYRNREALERVCKGEKPVIFAFWHGRLMMMGRFSPTPEKTHVMISRHGDGALIGDVVKYFGLQFIRGSTNREAGHAKGAKDRGGSSVLREAIEKLRTGMNIAVTPDGPRGPRQHITSTLVELAQKTGAVILPVTVSSSQAIEFNSWDKFLFTLPLGRSILICGEPVTVAEDADAKEIENTRKAIENQLNTLTYEADTRMGRVPTMPA